jgi:hypothetical protein
MAVVEIALVAAWAVVTVAWLLRRRRRELERARWVPRTRALEEGGHVIEIVCPGD